MRNGLSNFKFSVVDSDETEAENFSFSRGNMATSKDFVSCRLSTFNIHLLPCLMLKFDKFQFIIEQEMYHCQHLRTKEIQSTLQQQQVYVQYCVFIVSRALLLTMLHAAVI